MPSIKIGLFSDLHVTRDRALVRGASWRSFDDAQKGLAAFRSAGVAFAVALGDHAQPSPAPMAQRALLSEIDALGRSSGLTVYHVLGNHEFQQLDLDEVLAIFQMPASYYSFDLQGIRFIFLDTNFNPDGTHFAEDNFAWQFGIIPETECQWLDRQLAGTDRAILFTHANLHHDDPNYMILNHQEIVSLIRKHGCVRAVFQGHHHTASVVDDQGILFINIPSPLNSDVFAMGDFKMVEINRDTILYDGITYPWQTP